MGSRDLAGSRLGPYHLDKRYPEAEDAGGQLYAAHHVETGCPALVFVPEPVGSWAPRGDWTARVTSQASPPFLATELERPPPPGADALTDVELAFIRMAGGVACVEEREEANALFTRPSTSSVHGERRSTLWRRVGAGALVATVLGLGAVLLAPWLLIEEPEGGSVLTQNPDADSSIWIDRGEGSSPMGYPMPEKAFPQQEKPPCPKGYVEIRGGCWYQGKESAPCAEGAAEYEGKCYVPLREKKPEPRSVEP